MTRERENEMSKMGKMFYAMEEDAEFMTKEEFVDEYGTSNLAVWNEVNEEADWRESAYGPEGKFK